MVISWKGIENGGEKKWVVGIEENEAYPVGFWEGRGGISGVLGKDRLMGFAFP